MATGPASDLPLSDKAQRLAKEWAQNPQSKVFVPLAEEYARLGMLQRAAMVLEEGIGHYPGYVIAMVALGAVYFEMKERTSAKDVLEAAIQSSPENMKAHRVLAQLYAAEGNVEAARRSCTVVLMTNPLDEDMKALERILGPAPAPTARRLKASPAPTVSSPTPGLAADLEADSREDVSATPACEATSSGEAGDVPTAALPPVSLHAKRIARLERWLTRILAARQSA